MTRRTIIALCLACGVLSAYSPAQDTTRRSVTTKSPLPSQYDSTRALQSLKRYLDGIFTSPTYRSAKVSAKVISLTRGGATIYERNAEMCLTPASTTKLFSSATCFYLLGKNGTLDTEVRASGSISSDGTLNGDLYLVGRGDAFLSVNDVEYLADRLFASGIRRVNGSIFGDASFFDNVTDRSVYSGDGEVVSPVPPIVALSLTKSTIAVVVSASSKGHVSVQTIPASDAIVVNVVGGGRRRRVSATSSVMKDGRQLITVSGSPGANRTRTVYVNMRNPALIAAGVLSNRMRSGGIDTDPDKVGMKKAPSATRVVATFRRPLVDIASVVNKRSDNFLAEHLFKICGGLWGGQQNTAERAKEAIDAVMDSLGVKQRFCVFNDGSGLSRRNSVSAATEVDLLRAVHRSPFGEAYKSTLAIASVDGTIRGRMHGTPADSNVRAKTGTLRNVSALAGYVHTRDGELLAFSFISNGPAKKSFKHIEDLGAVALASFSYASIYEGVSEGVVEGVSTVVSEGVDEGVSEGVDEGVDEEIIKSVTTAKKPVTTVEKPATVPKKRTKIRRSAEDREPPSIKPKKKGRKGETVKGRKGKKAKVKATKKSSAKKKSKKKRR